MYEVFAGFLFSALAIYIIFIIDIYSLCVRLSSKSLASQSLQTCSWLQTFFFVFFIRNHQNASLISTAIVFLSRLRVRFWVFWHAYLFYVYTSWSDRYEVAKA